MAKNKRARQATLIRQEQQINQQNQNPEMEPNNDNNPLATEGLQINHQNPEMEPNIDDNNPPAAECLDDKLSKSQQLNCLLIAETAQGQQEVKSLKSELTLSELRIVTLKEEIEVLRADLRQLETKRNEMESAKFQGDVDIRLLKKIENDLRNQLNIQITESDKLREKKLAKVELISAELKELKSKYQLAANKLDDREKDIESMTIELDSAGRNCEELKRENELILREKETISKEKGDRIDELEKEVSQSNANVQSLEKDVEQNQMIMYVKSETTNAVMEEEIKYLAREVNDTTDCMKILEGAIWVTQKALVELANELKSVNQENEEILIERNRIELEKSETEKENSDLKQRVKDLTSQLSLVTISNKAGIEKNRKLGLEASEMKKKQAETEKSMKAMADNLQEKKKQNLKTLNKLTEEKSSAEKKLHDAQKKIVELESSMRSKSDELETALLNLKNTALKLSENKEGKKKNGKGGMEPYETHLEAIETAFREEGEKVGKMKNEMEKLRMDMEDARLAKSFWTVVSSATTTILAAAVVSIASSSSGAQ